MNVYLFQITSWICPNLKYYFLGYPTYFHTIINFTHEGAQAARELQYVII